MIEWRCDRRHQDCENKEDGSGGRPRVVRTKPALKADPELGEGSPVPGSKAAAAEDVVMTLVIMIVPTNFSRLLHRGHYLLTHCAASNCHGRHSWTIPDHAEPVVPVREVSPCRSNMNTDEVVGSKERKRLRRSGKGSLRCSV